MKTYTINSKSKFKFFYKPLLGGVLLDLIIVISFYYFKSMSIEKAIKLFLMLFAFMSIFINLPLTILFYSYLKKNKNGKLEIKRENDKNIFTLNNDSNQTIFSEDEISKVKFFVTKPVYKNDVRWVFWDEFFYGVIQLHNNNQYIITCLLSEDFNKYIPTNKIQKEVVFFPIITDATINIK